MQGGQERRLVAFYPQVRPLEAGGSVIGGSGTELSVSVGCHQGQHAGSQEGSGVLKAARGELGSRCQRVQTTAQEVGNGAPALKAVLGGVLAVGTPAGERKREAKGLGMAGFNDEGVTNCQ